MQQQHKSVKSKKVAIISYDLQQKEHRGIAVFSKALIRALQEAGAEIALIIDGDPPARSRNERHLDKHIRREIYMSRVLDILHDGYHSIFSRGSRPIFSKKYRILRKGLSALKNLLYLFDLSRRRFTVDLEKIPYVDLSSNTDSLYLRMPRLAFMSCISKIFCARYFYLNHYRAGTRKISVPIKIIASDYDLVISTSPLNAEVTGNTRFLQVIHDLIPLEYVPASGENIYLFAQCLIRAKKSDRIYVSKCTKKKYNQLFPNAMACTHSAVVFQPPSIDRQLLLISSTVDQSEAHINIQCNTKLAPYRYILFNASVDPRKNLLLAIGAFKNSGLSQIGMSLVVTGKLKKDDYSISVLSEADSAVHILGFVSEAVKADLYLNSLCTVNPSFVEGFGIPVLDSACIGSQTLASPCESHIEISEHYDFRDYISICDTNLSEWTSAIHRIAHDELKRINLVHHERSDRKERYCELESEIRNKFMKSVVDLISRGEEEC